MHYIITYGVTKHTSNEIKFMHQIVDDLLLAIMQLHQNAKTSNYILMNVLPIEIEKYLTQSIDAIKHALKIT